jgi:hypothetical protein
MKNWNWFKRRWFEFRTGHNVYLGFLLSFTNFLVIVYTFLIAQIPFLSNIFSSIVLFAVFGAVIYVPLAILVGHWHRNKQLETDVVVQAEKNPYYTQILIKLEEIEKKLDS